MEKNTFGVTRIIGNLDSVRKEISSCKSTIDDGEILDGMLIEVASSYAFQASIEKHKDSPPPMWPLRDKDWNPAESKVGNIIKAACILCMEIERIEQEQSVPKTL
jgi:hypothetical protein